MAQQYAGTVWEARTRAWMLELYHGPTAAFKDVGARFLAACLSRLEGAGAAPLTILVATRALSRGNEHRRRLAALATGSWRAR
mgnify:CR=1 FL=1